MKKIPFTIFIVSILCIWSCTKDSTSASSTVDCTNISAKFSQDIQPIFKSKCGNQGCHPAKDMENYNTLKTYVDNGKIKSYIADRNSPPSGMTTAGGCTQEESNKVACWIQSGALNN